jgi:hypothetical protein
MAEEYRERQPLGSEQGSQVLQIGVGSVDWRFYWRTIAVAAQVDGEYSTALGQSRGHKIKPVGIGSATMEEQHARRIVPPIVQVVEVHLGKR